MALYVPRQTESHGVRGLSEERLGAGLSAQAVDPMSAVSQQSPSEAKIALFRSLFRGSRPVRGPIASIVRREERSAYLRLRRHQRTDAGTDV